MRGWTCRAIVAAAAAGCGGEPAAPDAAVPDAVAIDASERFAASCQELHATDPALPSGPYTIDPDGPGGARPVSVTCDMTTDGGGWTIVFMAPTLNMTTAPTTYMEGTPRLMANAQSALLVYRTAARERLPMGITAQFDLPADWRTAPPLAAAGTDVVTAVSINGGQPVMTTVRYGHNTFSNFCGDPWSTAADWGRICVLGTSAPYFAGFTTLSADTCADSQSGYSVVACGPDRRFSIAVR